MKSEKSAGDVNETCPIYLASEAGDKNAVQLLLEGGADPNQFYQKRTALHIATWNNHFDVVKMLLQAGAKTDAPGDIPEFLAPESKFPEL